MSNDIDWDKAEEVEVPQGTFIGWGKVGQVVVGTVMKFSPDSGTDANGRPCPLLELELLDEAPSYSKKRDEWTKVPKGERVAITAGQANLKRALEEAAPKPTDKIRIEFSGTYETSKGTGKEFTVKIIRGSGNPWD